MKIPGPIIQVAGVHELNEAMMIARAGATHLGFPFALDFHKEDTSREKAAGIIRRLPKTLRPVLITYLNLASGIEELMRTLGCNIVQLHGQAEPDEIAKLRRKVPDIEIWKSLVIHQDDPYRVFESMRNYQDVVDAFITDTYDPETGASGATGKRHDWNISREIVNLCKKPVILAGGLNPENVFEAVKVVGPAGVDAHTGLENTEGIKDPRLVRDFVKNANRAFKKF